MQFRAHGTDACSAQRLCGHRRGLCCRRSVYRDTRTHAPLTESRERRKIPWERELVRFTELEDVAGRLVEDLLRFHIRSDEARNLAYEKLHFLRTATGHFLRYESIASALRDLENAAGWYIREDQKHKSREEYESARADISEGFRKLISTCDETLRNAPKGL